MVPAERPAVRDDQGGRLRQAVGPHRRRRPQVPRRRARDVRHARVRVRARARGRRRRDAVPVVRLRAERARAAAEGGARPVLGRAAARVPARRREGGPRRGVRRAAAAAAGGAGGDFERGFRLARTHRADHRPSFGRTAARRGGRGRGDAHLPDGAAGPRCHARATDL